MSKKIPHPGTRQNVGTLYISGSFGLSLLLRQYQARALRQVALTPEPILHGILELVKGNAGANFHLPVSDRQSVIEDGGIGEIAHGEGIEPFQRAGNGAAGVVILHADLAGEHRVDLNTKRDQFGRAGMYVQRRLDSLGKDL
jgi:hypothetical protein